MLKKEYKGVYCKPVYTIFEKIGLDTNKLSI